MREVDLNTLGSRSLEENVAGILSAFPGSMLVIIRDGSDYRAALLDRPGKYEEPSSYCRNSIDGAVAHLHETFVAQAAGDCSAANEHLSKLMTRVLPKGTSPRQSEEKK